MKILVYSPTFNPVKDGTSIQATRLFKMLSKKHESYGLGYAVDRDLQFNGQLMKIKDRIERMTPDFLNKTDRFPKLSGKNASLRINQIQPEIVHIRGWYQFDAVKSVIIAAINFRFKNLLAWRWLTRMP